MKRTKHKILSVFLSLCMIVSCMAGFSVTAGAATLDDISATTPQSGQNDYMAFGIGKSGSYDYSGYHSFNVNGIFNSSPIKSTYSDAGYVTALQVGSGDKTAVPNDGSAFVYGKVYTVDGVQIRITASLAAEAKSVVITYELCNTTDNSKIVKFGSSADTQIGNNDRAKTSFLANGILMEDDNSSSSTYGAQLKLIPGTGRFDTLWYGGYRDAYNNMFTQRDDPAEFTSDSGLAWSWTATIEAGAVVKKTTKLGMSDSVNYTVTYDGNGSDGGEVPIDTNDYETGDTVTVKDAGTMTRNGYSFDGWNTAADGSGTAYVAGDTITIGSADVTLYAQWEGAPHTHTWSCDANGNTITATCTGTGTCDITPAPTVTISADSKTYDGTVVTATVTKSANWTTANGLDEPGAITYSPANSANAGTYTASVTVGTATASVDFDIMPELITENDVTVAAEGLVYNGQAHEPEVTVTVGRTTLVEGTDYDLAYSNNVYASTNGDASATVTGKGNYHTDPFVEKTFTIAKADPDVTAPTAVSGLVYTGSDLTLVSEGSTTGGTLEYSTDGTSYGEGIPTGTNAGSYTVYYKVTGNDNYNSVAADTVPVSVAKAQSSAEAPTAIEGLVYTGSAQELVTAGTPTGGTMQYSLDGTSYDTAIPTGTDADNYSVYYKVVGDENHEDYFGESPVNVSIAKAPQDAPTNVGTVAETISKKEDGQITGVDSTMEYKSTTSDYTDITGTEITDLPAGEYQVRYAETDNYLASDAVTVTVDAGRKLNVTFEPNGGSDVAAQKLDWNAHVTEPTAPTKTGYTFTEWQLDGAAYDFTTLVTTDITLRAKWLKNPVEPVTSWRMPIGLGVYGIAGQEYTIAEKGSTPDWSSAQKAERDDDSINFYDLTPATWYTIYTRVAADAADPAAKTVSADKLTLLEGLGLTAQTLIGSSVTVTPYPMNVTGLTYQWYRVTITPVYPDYPDGAFTTDEEKIEGATGDTYTLTEADLDKYYIVKIYKDGEELMDSSECGPVEYGTVIFDSNGGSEVESATGLKYHDKVTKPSDPTRTGYTFLGWYFEGDEGDELWNFDEDVIEWNETTLFAKWQVNQYTITFDSNGGTAVAPITQDYGTPVTAPADPTLEDYTFAGWFPTIPTNMLAEDITLTAQWTRGDPGYVPGTVSETPTYTPVSEDYRLDISRTTPTDSENALLSGALEAGEQIGQPYEVKAFLGITQVYTTSRKLLVELQVPDELINTDPSVTRTFGILRIHDGEVTRLGSSYDPAVQTVSAYSDLFSVYAVTYTDASESDVSGETDTDEPDDSSRPEDVTEIDDPEVVINDGDPDNTVTPDDASVVVNAPDGESNPHTGAPIVGLAALAMSASAAAAAFTAKKRKKK